MRQLVLDGQIPVLRVGQARAVAGGREHASKEALAGIGVRQSSFEGWVGIVEPVGGVVGEARRTRAGVDRDARAVSARETAEAPVVPDRRHVGHRVAAAHDHLVRHLVGEAEPRTELTPVRVLEAVAEDESSGQASRSRVRRVEIDLRHAVRQFEERLNDLPTEPEIQRELRRDFPVVREVETVARLPMPAVERCDVSACRVDRPEQKARERVPGFVAETGQVGLDRPEIERSGSVLGTLVHEVAPVFVANPEGVRRLDDRQVVLEDPASVEALAGVAGADPADAAALPFLPGEAHRRKVRRRGTLHADLGGPVLVDEDRLVAVPEAVVAAREPVEDRVGESRVDREPHHARRRVLVLPSLGRKAGNGFVPRSAVVVADPVLVVEHSRHAVLVVDVMVALGPDRVEVEEGAARADRGRVADHGVDLGIDQAHIEDVRIDLAEAARRDGVVRERQAGRAACGRSGAARIENRAEDRALACIVRGLGAGRGVAGEAGIEQAAEVALLEVRGSQGRGETGDVEIGAGRPLEVREEKGLVAAVVHLGDFDRAADRIAVVVLPERRFLLDAARVVGVGVRVQAFVLPVVEHRAVQAVRARLDVEIGDRGMAAVVLGVDGARVQLELADGLGGRTHLVVVAARQVHAAHRDALDQDLVRVLLPAIDGALEFAASCARKAAEDETLDLALAILDEDRPVLVLLRTDIAADLGGA